ncbi:MAG: phospholipase D family protein [Sulfuritalea sp.]|nr:phospholipase D family protein [Sulfuritalea sp.]
MSPPSPTRRQGFAEHCSAPPKPAARATKPAVGRGLPGWSLLVTLALCFGGSVGAGAAPLPATGTVEALFTPWDDAEGAIVRALGEARQSIHVQAYLLTSRSIARALQDAKARGVAVEILADKEMVGKGENSLIPKLAAEGIPVWLETRYANAHNKVLLVDALGAQGFVITGSYNFTWSAQARNAENLLILRDNPALLRRYLENWRRHRDEAEKMNGTK